MYTFRDKDAIQSFGGYVACLARIGEYVWLRAEPQSLTAGSTNSSHTVVSQAVFAGPCFRAVAGGRPLAVQIRSKAVDAVFARLDPDRTQSCTLSFGKMHRNSHVVEVRIQTISVSRVHYLTCLETAQSMPPISSIETMPFSFACSLDFIKEVLASCMVDAEEAELRFIAHRGFTFRAFKNKNRQSALRPGVDTSIDNVFTQFDQLKVQTPWVGTIRLKELRYMLALYETLFPEELVQATFSEPGEPLVFRAYHSSLASGFQFAFMTKAGPAADHGSVVQIAHGTALFPEFPTAEAQPIIEEPVPERLFVQDDEELDLVAEIGEDGIGPTQGASQAAGLFDEPPRKRKR